ncbi:MAG TPA: serine hydrolase [Pirellulales bacterium]|nr:serine hydrolase [Pirellulales bacterium]
MPIRRFIAIVFSLLASVAARAADSDTLESTARRIADQIAAKPQIEAKLYASEFLDTVPAQELSNICRSIFAKTGKVLEIQRQSGGSTSSGKFLFRSRDSELMVDLIIDVDEPHRVLSLELGSPSPRIKNWDDFTGRLAKLPGEVSFQAMRLDDGKVLGSHQPDTVLGIGSAFKLYVLATLVDKKVPWDEIVTVEDRYKSLPSGVVQNWPAGTPTTVQTLAIQMLSLSDNTATDHLIALVGREEVEKRLELCGMKSPPKDEPLLMTREWFRLKSHRKLRNEFLAADQGERRAILKRMAEMPRMNDADEEWNGPLAIDSIEWFASSADLCRVLDWLDKHGGKNAQAIMAVNSGGISDDQFTYVGYKSGSESGVLSLNWLLHARDGKHYALSAIWNNKVHRVDRAELLAMMKAAARLLVEPEKKD